MISNRSGSRRTGRSGGSARDSARDSARSGREQRGTRRERPRTHPEVEYAVEDGAGRERIFKTFDEAAAFALSMAVSRGEATLDILVWSEKGAHFVGGDDAVEQYREDPEASVFERLEISVNSLGRVA